MVIESARGPAGEMQESSAQRKHLFDITRAHMLAGLDAPTLALYHYAVRLQARQYTPDSLGELVELKLQVPFSYAEYKRATLNNFISDDLKDYRKLDLTKVPNLSKTRLRLTYGVLNFNKRELSRFFALGIRSLDRELINAGIDYRANVVLNEIDLRAILRRLQDPTARFIEVARDFGVSEPTLMRSLRQYTLDNPTEQMPPRRVRNSQTDAEPIDILERTSVSLDNNRTILSSLYHQAKERGLFKGLSSISEADFLLLVSVMQLGEPTSEELFEFLSTQTTFIKSPQAMEALFSKIRRAGILPDVFARPRPKS